MYSFNAYCTKHECHTLLKLKSDLKNVSSVITNNSDIPVRVTPVELSSEVTVFKVTAHVYASPWLLMVTLGVV